MARTSTTVGLALLLVASVAGCNHTHVVGANRTLHLALTEYRLSPQRVQAPAGKLTIFVVNDGRLTHNLAILRGGHTASSTQPISPGAGAELTVSLPKGTYLMDSTMLSDQDLGLYGTLIVK